MRILAVLPLLAFTMTLGAEAPEARWGHVLVYDEVRGEVLLFGGASERGTFRGDTWTWKQGVWTEHGADGPGARGFAAAAFEPVSGAVVIHGGRGNGRVTLSDTWSWDGSGWTLVESDGDWKADHHQIAWDPKRRKLIGFGGWDGSDVVDSTWAFEAGWKRIQTSGPAPRATHGMAWDGDRERIVVYGGLWQSGQYADKWEWDGHDWTQLTGPYDDSSLDHLSMAWDPTRGELILFGGKNYRKELNGRTRVLSGGKWVARALEGPSPRHSAPLAWHAGLERVLVFGGKVYDCEEQLPLGDFWAWDGTRWTRIEDEIDPSRP